MDVIYIHTSVRLQAGATKGGGQATQLDSVSGRLSDRQLKRRARKNQRATVESIEQLGWNTVDVDLNTLKDVEGAGLFSLEVVDGAPLLTACTARL